MSQLYENLACVADAQGYEIDGEFYICELVFYNDENDLYKLFDPDLPWTKITEKQFKTIKFTKDYVHGLDYLSVEHNPSSKTARKCIQEFYQKCATGEKKIVGVKNHHLERELKMMKIPCMSLETVPKLSILDKFYCSCETWICNNHDKKKVFGLRCSVRKCYHIWKWIKSNSNTKPVNK